MKPIDRSEVLGLADYETIRDRFRTRVIGEKKRRRVQIGPNATALFENRDTILLQIQEMLRTERITRSGAIQHEIDTYNDNLPGDDELSCTLMIEIADPAERDAFLRSAVGLEQHVWLVANQERVHGRAAVREGGASDRTTAVHYLKFSLPLYVAASIRALRQPPAPSLALEIQITHPAYDVAARLAPETARELAEDLAE